MSLLNWNDKKNSALLADFIAKHGPEYCMTAEEINEMRDAVNEMAVIQQSVCLGPAEPTDTPTGSGRNYWEVIVPGTYTDFGGVVLEANKRGLIYRDETGAFSISQVGLDLTEYQKEESFKNEYLESKNLFNKETVFNGYYGISGTIFQADPTYWTSDFMPVIEGSTYKRVGTNNSTYIYFYDSEKLPFTPAYVDGGEVTIPVGVTFVRIIVLSDDVDETMFVVSTVDTENYIPFALKIKKSRLNLSEYQKEADFKTEYLYYENSFNKETIFNGFYGIDGVTFQADPTYSTSDFIPVSEGLSYKRVGTDNSTYIYFYDSEKLPFTPAYVGSGEVTIPVGVAFVRIVFLSADVDETMFVVSTVDTENYIPFALKIKKQLIPSLSILKQIDNTDVGALDYQEIDSTDYSHIILYGQSLSQGYESPRVITTEAILGNFMVGTAPYYFGENLNATVLNPLIAVKNNVMLGEPPIVSLTNVFSKLYRRFVNKNQLFIGSNPSQDGKSIEMLSKECTNGTTALNNLYNQRYQKLLTDTKSIVDSLMKTVSCPAIIYMQGEYNYVGLSGAGLTAGTDASADKNTYKAYLTTLKNNMQADAVVTYGQTKKPLFFIYETAGSYINRIDMSINMAQVEFAQENDDVFLLNPTYFTPDYGGGHLSTNGYRWYGEMMAKSLYNVFVKGKSFSPIYPEYFKVEENKINIDFRVPVLPLKFDVKTTPLVTNYGFSIIQDGVVLTISDIAILNNRVVITLSNALSGDIEIVYAGVNTSGSGNLRDSDSYVSMYKYFDDSADLLQENYTPKNDLGIEIYGKNYPMYNWCSNFYKLIVVN